MICKHTCLKCGEVFVEHALPDIPISRHGQKSIHWHCGAQAIINLAEGDSLYGIPLGLQIGFSPEKRCTVQSISAFGNPKRGNVNVRFESGATETFLWWLPDTYYHHRKEIRSEPRLAQQAPSIEAMIRTCAEIWGEDIDTVRFTMSVSKGRGGFHFRASLTCSIGDSCDNHAFIADGPSETAVLIELNERVAAAFCESKHVDVSR